MGKVVLVTGATSGVGQACAEALSARGFTVYGAGRRVKEGSAQPGLPYRLLRCDVTSTESVAALVRAVIGEAGRIDVLINSAGFAFEGGVEDSTTDEARMQFDTNFFGAHRVCREVMPHMRRQRDGLILNISSVAAEFTVPFQGFYSLSKAALDGLTAAIRMEGRPFGIRAASVKPGDIRSGFTAARRTARALDERSPHHAMTRRSVEQMKKDEQAGISPGRVAALVLRLVQRRRLRARYLVEAKYKLLVFLKRLVPAGLIEKVLWQMYVGG